MKTFTHLALQSLVAIASVAALADFAGAQQAASTSSFDDVWAAAAMQNFESPARAYNMRWASHEIWNDNGVRRLPKWPQQKAVEECVTALMPTPSAVRLAFRLDDNGVVTHAYTDQAGYIDECVPRKTIGMRVPAPPSAPFLLCQRFEKLEQGYRLTGC